MGLTETAIAMPRRRLSDKQLRQAGLARGYEALAVPWFDEDALTLALDAALALGDSVERARRVVLALNEAHGQAALVQHALDVDAPLVELVGPLAGYQALQTHGPGPTLVLAGAAGTAGAGVAVMLEPETGVEVASAADMATAPLGGDEAQALRQAVGELADAGPLRVPMGTPGRRSLAECLEAGLTRRIGEVGAAGLLVELVDALDQHGGPVRVAGVGGGRAVAMGSTEGTLERVHRVPERRVDVTAEAVEGLEDPDVPAWSEASQGAYVSRADYDAEPRERYGARALGRGTVAAVTTIEAGPPGEFVRQHEAAGPYDVVVVQDDGGKRRIHQSAMPPGELSIGDRVQRVLRRLFSMEEQWRYAVKVVEVEGSQR